MRGEAHTTGHGDHDDGGRVLEWEEGLPSGGDLAPLSQTLVTPELASAFGITPEPPRTVQDVCRASSDTIASLGCLMPSSSSSSSSSSSDLSLGMLPSFAAAAAAAAQEPVVIVRDESGSEEDGGGCYSDKLRRLDSVEEADSPVGMDNPSFDGSARVQKRPRLVWTSQLHKRFVDVVAYLGIKNAVPKTVMHLMNVEGLTRENVASHLQKYRLFLRRNEGLSNGHLVTSTLVPQSLREAPIPVPMQYAAVVAAPPVERMPVLGMAQNGPGAHVTVVPVSGQHCAVAYQGFQVHHPYALFEKRRMDFPGGKNFCPMVPYRRVSPNDK